MKLMLIFLTVLFESHGLPAGSSSEDSFVMSDFNITRIVKR